MNFNCTGNSRASDLFDLVTRLDVTERSPFLANDNSYLLHAARRGAASAR